MKTLFTFLIVALAAFTTSAQVLPVELISFTAIAKSNVVELRFETASEVNASHFEIERGIDPTRFEKIATIPCAGKANTYQYIDDAPLPRAYYRLKQIDFDRKVTTFKTISVENTPLSMQVVDGVIYSKGLIEVYNLNGQLLASDFETLNLSDIKGGQMVLIKTNTLIKYYLQ